MCLSSNELLRIKASMSKDKPFTLSPFDPITAVHVVNEEQRRAKAKARKEHMIALDMEKSKREKCSNKANSAKNGRKANTEQSQDVVKLLDSCFQRAAAFTVRDKQLKEKELEEKREKDYERMMEVSMEVNRLKDIEAREKEEEARNRKRVQDRKVIEHQIRERQHQRLLQDEARDQENKTMLSLSASLTRL